MTDEEIEWLDALLDLEDGLTDYEVEFVESLSKKTQWQLSERQHDFLQRIYDKHF